MTPLTDRAGRFSALKTATFAGLLLPAAHLAWRGYSGDLGPLPLKEALHVAGDWTVYFIVGVLALTPLQRILEWSRLALIRRMVGVAAFAYAALHFMLHLANSKFAWITVATEIAIRPYLLIGFVALAGLSALAATSTDGALRLMGARWKQLHRLVYGIAVLAVLHYLMQSKIDASAATLWAGLFLLLMIYRLAVRLKFELNLPVLLTAAAAGAMATAIAEFAWYAIATGADPWRIAAANLAVTQSLRPAIIVGLTGLGVAALAIVRRAGRRGLPSGTSRTRQPVAARP